MLRLLGRLVTNVQCLPQLFADFTSASNLLILRDGLEATHSTNGLWRVRNSDIVQQTDVSPTCIVNPRLFILGER